MLRINRVAARRKQVSHQYSLKSCPVHGPTPLRSSTTHLGLGRPRHLRYRFGSQMTDGASSDCPLSAKDGHVSLAPTEGL